MLRLREGEAVVACDGAGSWVSCRWAPPSGRAGPASPLVVAGDVVTAEPVDPPVAVGFVPTKGDRPDWVVQRCTEIGVDRIVVLASERSVVRWDGPRAERHLAKLVEVARQAGMQSRRVRLPTIEGVVPVGSLVHHPLPSRPSPAPRLPPVEGPPPAGRASAPPGGWAMAVPGGPPLRAGTVGVLIGPEGGWSEAEERCGLPTVGLGPGILRAETAALAAATLLVGLRAGSVAHAP